MIKGIVRELVEFSVSWSRRRTCCGNFARMMSDDRTELFVKGSRPPSDAAGHSLGDPGRAEEWKARSLLNRRDVRQYLDGAGSWSAAELDLRLDDNPGPRVSRVLGFLVHDALASLRDQPAAVVDVDDVPFGPVLGVVDRGGYGNRLPKREFGDALRRRDVLLVMPETAVEFCLRAYHRESDVGELVTLLGDNDDDDDDNDGDDRVKSYPNGNYDTLRFST